jgi:hypothetical protein
MRGAMRRAEVTRTRAWRSCSIRRGPAGLRGGVLMGNIHGQRINMDILEPKGSGYVGKHGADFINFNDRASQIVDLREGPDGTLFMIDWYDLNQCHRVQREAHDYTTGTNLSRGKEGSEDSGAAIGEAAGPGAVQGRHRRRRMVVAAARRIMQERKLDEAKLRRTGDGVLQSESRP